MKRYKIFGWIIIVVTLFLYGLTFRTVSDDISYGVNFSKFHADELELNFKIVLPKVLDELGVRRFRFTAHWTEIEPQKDKYHFEDIDWQLREAQKRDAEVILALGMRLPGWPECHIPDWARDLSEQEREKAILDMLEDSVNHFKQFDNITAWQVENEYFLSVFGLCPELRQDFIDEEIALVKSLDDRPILITDSGEFGQWHQAYRRGDFFGTTLYRIVHNDVIGFFKYPIDPGFFAVKRNLVRLFFGEKKIVVIELQGEPWSTDPLVETPLETQYERFSFKEFKDIVPYTKKAGFDEMYFWGAEWWYWMKTTQDDDRYWEFGKSYFEPR